MNYCYREYVVKVPCIKEEFCCDYAGEVYGRCASELNIKPSEISCNFTLTKKTHRVEPK